MLEAVVGPLRLPTQRCGQVQHLVVAGVVLVPVVRRGGRAGGALAMTRCWTAANLRSIVSRCSISLLSSRKNDARRRVRASRAQVLVELDDERDVARVDCYIGRRPACGILSLGLPAVVGGGFGAEVVCDRIGTEV